MERRCYCKCFVSRLLIASCHAFPVFGRARHISHLIIKPGSYLRCLSDNVASGCSCRRTSFSPSAYLLKSEWLEARPVICMDTFLHLVFSHVHMYVFVHVFAQVANGPQFAYLILWFDRAHVAPPLSLNHRNTHNKGS